MSCLKGLLFQLKLVLNVINLSEIYNVDRKDSYIQHGCSSWLVSLWTQLPEAVKKQHNIYVMVTDKKCLLHGVNSGHIT